MASKSKIMDELRSRSGQLPALSADREPADTVAVSDAPRRKLEQELELELRQQQEQQKQDKKLEMAQIEARAKVVIDATVQSAVARDVNAAGAPPPQVVDQSAANVVTEDLDDDDDGGGEKPAAHSSADDGDSNSDDDDDDDDPSFFVTVTDEHGNERRVSPFQAGRIERVRRNKERLVSLGLAGDRTLLSGEMERAKEERREKKEQRKKELAEMREANRRSSPRKRQPVSHVEIMESSVEGRKSDGERKSSTLNPSRKRQKVSHADVKTSSVEGRKSDGGRKSSTSKRKVPKPGSSANIFAKQPENNYSSLPLYPKQDKLPGWKICSKVNPVLYVSPVRKIPFRSLKQAAAFAELVRVKGDEYASFKIIEEEYRCKKRANGRDLIYSVVASLPEDDRRRRGRPIQPTSILGKRSDGGRLEYLIQFESGTPIEDAWVAKQQLSPKAKKMAKEFDIAEKIKKREGPALEFLPSEFADPGTSPLVLNGGPVKMQVMAIPGKVATRCFLDSFAPGRFVTMSYDISNARHANKYRPEAEIHQNGGTYTAVCTRVVDQKTSGGRNFGPKRKEAHVYYILTKGGGKADINLQKLLEDVADWKSEPAVKIPARLELLTSPTPSSHPGYVRRIKSTNFSTIEENGNEGCGFAPPNFIEDLLGNTAEARRADAIQVRIFGPNVGVAKGMLVKKQTKENKIELPPSMIKVPPSLSCDEDWAVVVVSDVFPSKRNQEISNFNDPRGKDPTGNQLKWHENNVKFSKMYARLLESFGVPAKVLRKYHAQIKKSAAAIKHTHLVGVADPTDQLPPGTIFIPGYVGNMHGARELFGARYPRIFLSRSPALVPSDAKLLEIVHKKPSSMTQENWNFLCSFRFGTVVFSAPLNGMPPLPCQVGEGDLDGDLYLCVFAPMILQSLDRSKSRAKNELRVCLAPFLSSTPSSATENLPEDSSSSWLIDAQKKFLDLSHLATSSALVGRLYTDCNKKIDEHGFGHPKSRALSRAYKDSLDVKKHSLTIALPADLRNEIKDKKLRDMVQIAPETNDDIQNLTDNDDAEEEGFSTVEDDNSSDDESTGTSGSEESDGCVDYYY